MINVRRLGLEINFVLDKLTKADGREEVYVNLPIIIHNVDVVDGITNGQIGIIMDFLRTNDI